MVPPCVPEAEIQTRWYRSPMMFLLQRHRGFVVATFASTCTFLVSSAAQVDGPGGICASGEVGSAKTSISGGVTSIWWIMHSGLCTLLTFGVGGVTSIW
jgi:hypothetical protein